MTCPVCGKRASVVDVRNYVDHVIRKRKCDECGYIFYTTEIENDLRKHLEEFEKKERNNV